MLILAIDIGFGTQDILLFDTDKNIENCIKMILPTPSLKFSNYIKNLERDIKIAGDTIGGDRVSKLLKKHVQKGYKVEMTESAAMCIRDDIDEVRGLGIDVVEDISKPDIYFKEFDLAPLKEFLLNYDINLSDVEYIALAVQDHGTAEKGMSDRKFRMINMSKALSKAPVPESFVYTLEEVPVLFKRMGSLANRVKNECKGKKGIIMDTSPCAILGCLSSEEAAYYKEPYMVINFGNKHIMAAIINENSKITGLFEHHTPILRNDTKKLTDFLKRFADGTLSDEEVFEDYGNGVFYYSCAPNFDNLNHIVVTGPNRRLIKSTGFRFKFAAPAGDMMITGPLGLVIATKIKYNLDFEV